MISAFSDAFFVQITGFTIAITVLGFNLLEAKKFLRERNKKMKIYISVDMEGIGGICTPSQTLPEGAEYQKARKLMIHEINAAVTGALQGGAIRVIVNDAHNTMTNILLEELHPKAELISGYFKTLSMMEGIDESFHCAFLMGYHAGAGTPKGVLAHTFIPANIFSKVKVNDTIVNEAYLNSALAGHFGVPVCLMVGDKWAIEQSRFFLPNAKTVATKEGLGMYSALYYPLEKLKEDITNAAFQAVLLKADPFRVKCPVTFSIEMVAPVMVERALLIPMVKKTGNLSVEFTAENYLIAYKLFTAICGLASQAKDDVY